MMTRDTRKGQNEVWFRDLNERLEDRALEKQGHEGLFSIVCECDQEECAERLSITFNEYERIRATPTTFVVARGHVDLSCETIVSSTQVYEIVEKTGQAALVAEREDPR
jgi:hypothetical protein